MRSTATKFARTLERGRSVFEALESAGDRPLDGGDVLEFALLLGFSNIARRFLTPPEGLASAMMGDLSRNASCVDGNEEGKAAVEEDDALIVRTGGANEGMRHSKGPRFGEQGKQAERQSKAPVQIANQKARKKSTQQ